MIIELELGGLYIVLLIQIQIVLFGERGEQEPHRQFARVLVRNCSLFLLGTGILSRSRDAPPVGQHVSARAPDLARLHQRASSAMARVRNSNSPAAVTQRPVRNR